MNDDADQKEVEERAKHFARRNKTAIAKRLTDPESFPAELAPVSVFMAGSPGAGKTEAAIALIDTVAGDEHAILRIDPDELRVEFEEYTGDNSWLFQSGVSILVDKIHDLALKQKQSFLLDGTLTNYNIAKKNIGRSLSKERVVLILYVYQAPNLAWDFVKARELAEGRKIKAETFVRQYFAARSVVNKLKSEFSSRIQVDLLLKNNDGSDRVYKANIDQIDHHIPERYNRKEVELLIGMV